jgi:hypothetical protein
VTGTITVGSTLAVTPQAEALIRQVAQGQSGPTLQMKAIRMLAAAQGKRTDDTLASIYQHTSDAEVKRVILQSYLITGNSSKLLEVSRQETNPELVKAAIQTLGAMSATQDLLTMYRGTSNVQTKADILNALVASGHNGVSPLSEIAQSEQNAELRDKAIRNLGIAGGMSVAPALVTTYRRTPMWKRSAPPRKRYSWRMMPRTW